MVLSGTGCFYAEETVTLPLLLNDNLRASSPLLLPLLLLQLLLHMSLLIRAPIAP